MEVYRLSLSFNSFGPTFIRVHSKRAKRKDTINLPSLNTDFLENSGTEKKLFRVSNLFSRHYIYFWLYHQLLEYPTYKPCRIATNTLHLLLLSHISLSVSSRSIFVIPALSADTHRLRFGLSVALYVILSISISRLRSHSAIPLAPL